MSTQPLIEVASMQGGYGSGAPAIGDVSFEVAEGQLVAVLGPNGGGKTTLFRALLDELPLRRGRVVLRADIAYVPQTERARLDFPVSALDVALMGTYGRSPWYRRLGGEQRDAGLTALRRVGLEAEADSPFGELSGGQRQRVLIARALAQGAGITLLDEPLTGVDRASEVRIRGILAELRDEGKAILVATHDISQAGDFDMVLCINGSQVAFGPPQATLDPRTLERTYGSELIVLEGGERAVIVSHHAH